MSAEVADAPHRAGGVSRRSFRFHAKNVLVIHSGGLRRRLAVDREVGVPTWLLTSTTYGTWLPGDARGSVTSVREQRAGEDFSASRREHDRPGEAYEAAMMGLQRSAVARMKGPPVLISGTQAHLLLDQFLETATHRQTTLHAAAIMANHFHLVVTPTDNLDPSKLLGDFKAYGSRALNAAFGKPASGTWWTAQGSKRLLRGDEAITAAVNYVLHKQPHPLVTWSSHQES